MCFKLKSSKLSTKNNINSIQGNKASKLIRAAVFVCLSISMCVFLFPSLSFSPSLPLTHSLRFYRLSAVRIYATLKRLNTFLLLYGSLRLQKEMSSAWAWASVLIIYNGIYSSNEHVPFIFRCFTNHAKPLDKFFFFVLFGRFDSKYLRKWKRNLFVCILLMNKCKKMVSIWFMVVLKLHGASANGPIIFICVHILLNVYNKTNNILLSLMIGAICVVNKNYFAFFLLYSIFSNSHRLLSYFTVLNNLILIYISIIYDYF